MRSSPPDLGIDAAVSTASTRARESGTTFPFATVRTKTGSKVRRETATSSVLTYRITRCPLASSPTTRRASQYTGRPATVALPATLKPPVRRAFR